MAEHRAERVGELRVHVVLDPANHLLVDLYLQGAVHEDLEQPAVAHHSRADLVALLREPHAGLGVADELLRVELFEHLHHARLPNVQHSCNGAYLDILVALVEVPYGLEVHLDVLGIGRANKQYLAVVHCLRLLRVP